MERFKTLPVQGTDLAYLEQGQGPPLVLVHGTLVDARYWAAQVEQCAARYRVIAVSLRHHYPNASVGDLSDYGLLAHVADVATLLRTLTGEPVHLVGHSSGGFIALLLTRDYPDLVRSLVLEEPALLGDLIANAQDKAEAEPILASTGPMAQEVIAQLDVGNREGAIRTFIEWALGPGAYDQSPDAFRASWMDNVHTLKRTLTSAPESFTREDVGTLKAPTLLVGGDASPRLFPLMMNGLQSYLQTVERVTIPQASHAVHEDNPAAFNRAVLEFVGRH